MTDITNITDALLARTIIDNSHLDVTAGPAWITIYAAAAHHADWSTSATNELMLAIAGQALRYVREHAVVEKAA